MGEDGPATRIGGYLLESELGRGATGIVYRARDEGTHDVAALKLLDPLLSDDASFRARFEREAQAMRRLDDEHCVAIYDSGLDASGAWIAMEYVHGATLREVLGRAGHLTPAQACGVLLGALAGLQRVHDVGLIHRDLKPENILVDVTGSSKLADFGLVADHHAGRGWRAIEGSPAYMSPEQVRGEALDLRSDLYAAGVVLYELLTGRPPFVGDTPLATLHAQIESPPPPIAGLPERVGAVVLRALSKARDERPASAEELAAALRDAAEHDLGTAWIAAAGIAGLVAGAVGAGVASRAGSSSVRARRNAVDRIRRGLSPVAAAGLAAAAVVAVVAAIALSGTGGGSTKQGGRPRLAANGTTTVSTPRTQTCTAAGAAEGGGPLGFDVTGVACPHGEVILRAFLEQLFGTQDQQITVQGFACRVLGTEPPVPGSRISCTHGAEAVAFDLPG